MANINEILARAAALRDETALNSISPERAGSIMYDTLIALNELWLQQGAALVISKIYASVDAMEADTAPVSDLSGKPLRPGQIVVIASSDSDNGSVYRYNGTDSPSWSLVGEIGNLDPVDNLESDSTSLPLAAHQGKVLDGKISQLGQESEIKVNDIILRSFSNVAQSSQMESYTLGEVELESGVKYIAFIISDNNLGQSKAYISVRTINSEYVNIITHENDSFDLSKGEFCEFELTADATKVFAFLQGADAGVLNIVIVKKDDILNNSVYKLLDLTKAMSIGLYKIVKDEIKSFPAQNGYSSAIFPFPLKSGKKYDICIQSDVNLGQSNFYLSASNGSTVVSEIVHYTTENIKSIRIVRYEPQADSSSLYASIQNISSAGNVRFLAKEIDEFPVIPESNDDIDGNVIFDEYLGIQKVSGYSTFILPFPLKEKKNYAFVLRSNIDMEQTNLYISTTGQSSSQIIDTFKHLTTEDLSTGIIVFHSPILDSVKIMLSIEGVTNAGVLRLSIIDLDAIQQVAKEVSAITKGGNISSVLSKDNYVCQILDCITYLVESIIYDKPNVRISGKVWGYSNDPNGVFPATRGTILQLPNKTTDDGSYTANPFPAIKIKGVGHTSGIIEEIGINGYADDSDTRGLFDLSNPYKHAGIYVDADSPIDQFRFTRINCQGLGVGISIENEDACNIDRINADGCDVGIYSGGGAFLSIENCILSDTLSFGLLIWGTNPSVYRTGIRVINNIFTRNGYNISNEQFPDIPQYAVCLKINSSFVLGNSISSFGYWQKHAGTSEDLTNLVIGGLYVGGNRNIISNNHITTDISGNTAYALEVNGNNNVVSDSNIIEGTIRVRGSNNIIKYIPGVTDIYLTTGETNIIDELYDNSMIHYI